MTPRLQTLCLCAMLSLLTLAAYFPVFGFDFVNYDDPKYVTQNRHVVEGLTPAGIAYAWTTFDLGNWIPLTWMSYLLDATLFGVRPFGFHATNLLAHAANSCLLFYVLQRMTGCTARSALAAALFAVHPLHIQSVAWIAERKDVLSTFWLLIALVVYQRYAARPTIGLYCGVFAAMALGLLAKSMLVTLPILLLLLDFWPLNRWAIGTPAPEQPFQRTAGCLLLEKVPLLCLSLADGVITVIAQNAVRATSILDSYPWPIRVGNAVRSVGWYLGKTLWPADLCPFYPHPMSSLSWREVWWSLGVIVAISVWIAWNGFRKRYLVTGWLWFLVALLPVLGLLQVGGHAQADRYVYVPHIGLFVLIVWTAADWAERGLVARGMVRIGAAAAILGCLVLTRQELAPWRNSETLWEHALKVNPDSYVAHQLLAITQLEQKRYDEAEAHLRQALILNPTHYETIMSLGMLHMDRQEWDLAFEHLEWGLRLNPDDPRGQLLWRRALQLGGDKRSARPAGRHDPHPDAKKELELGQTLYQQGDVPAAQRHILESLQKDPDYPEAHNCLGIVLVQLGEHDQAERHFQQAIAKDPDNPDFPFNLADLYEHQSRWREAIACYEMVLKLSPADAEARSRLSRLQRRKDP